VSKPLEPSHAKLLSYQGGRELPLQNLRRFFLGKDARDLDLIPERVFVYGFNFRYSGISLGLPLATLEFAILDLLGRLAGRSLGELIGEIHHPEVAVYVATEWRERPLEETFDRIKRAAAQYDAKALKIKVGSLMFMSTDLHARGPVGKTSPLKVVNGRIKVPTGPGTGVDIDPEFIQRHRPVTL
jgi:L-alanine-DL-glutamate epimerase-like enolase superfamily enzyme